jgi:hypothetical protein
VPWYAPPPLTYIVLIKGGASERCDLILVSLENASFHMVHVYTINWFKKVQNINNYCSHAIEMNGPYPEITNISFLAKLFFKTFISLKHLSDYRTVGPSDYRTVGLSDCRIIATANSSQAGDIIKWSQLKDPWIIFTLKNKRFAVSRLWEVVDRSWTRLQF